MKEKHTAQREWEKERMTEQTHDCSAEAQWFMSAIAIWSTKVHGMGERHSRTHKTNERTKENERSRRSKRVNASSKIKINTQREKERKMSKRFVKPSSSLWSSANWSTVALLDDGEGTNGAHTNTHTHTLNLRCFLLLLQLRLLLLLLLASFESFCCR